VVGPYIDQEELFKADSSYRSFQFNYILYQNGELYGKNGAEFIMDHVVWVDTCDIAHELPNNDERNYASTYILCDDGILYEKKPIYEQIDEYNREFLRYEIVKLAENVALPGQPFSSIKTGRVKTVGGFADVLETDWFAESVLWAVEKGITSGTSATTFTPERTCSVAEILTFLWRSQGEPTPKGPNPFTDVPEGKYYTDAAIWACEMGLVEGSVFNGDADCTRAMAVTYLWKLAGAPEAEGERLLNFSDMPYELKSPITWAVDNGITNGVGKDSQGFGRFAPDNTCTRAQIVTFLYRAYGDD
jgi:hypothetical protein